MINFVGSYSKLVAGKAGFAGFFPNEVGFTSDESQLQSTYLKELDEEKVSSLYDGKLCLDLQHPEQGYGVN